MLQCEEVTQKSFEAKGEQDVSVGEKGTVVLVWTEVFPSYYF